MLRLRYIYELVLMLYREVLTVQISLGYARRVLVFGMLTCFSEALLLFFPLLMFVFFPSLPFFSSFFLKNMAVLIFLDVLEVFLSP